MRFILIYIFLCSTLGCSTVYVKSIAGPQYVETMTGPQVRGDDVPGGYGHPYNGLTFAIDIGGCTIKKAEVADAGFMIFMYIYSIIDIPSSAVVDTIMLPFDLIIYPEYERQTWDDCTIHF